MHMFFHMMRPYPLPWGFAGVGMQFIMVFAWALVGAGAFMVIRDLIKRGQNAPAGHECRESGRATLDRRLASGEISSEEYDAIRHKIEG